MRVLVVDDDTMVRRLMTDCLSDAGYEVAEAVSADDAIDRVERDGDYELVVTDVRMPGTIDGFALSSWLKDRQPATRVLIVSGFSGDEPKGRRYDAFLGKPFTVSSLERAVSEVVGGYNSGG